MEELSVRREWFMIYGTRYMWMVVVQHSVLRPLNYHNENRGLNSCPTKKKPDLSGQALWCSPPVRGSIFRNKPSRLDTQKESTCNGPISCWKQIQPKRIKTFIWTQLLRTWLRTHVNEPTRNWYFSSPELTWKFYVKSFQFSYWVFTHFW